MGKIIDFAPKPSPQRMWACTCGGLPAVFFLHESGEIECQHCGELQTTARWFLTDEAPRNGHHDI